MRLSRTIVYAIQAVLQLADSPGAAAISRGQLAAAGPLPGRFLLEVLHALVAHGLVYSTRGVDGGFSLARPPETITLRDICEAFDFPRRPYVPSVEGQPIAIREQLLAALEQASSAALAELQKVTLAEMRRVGSIKGLIQNGVSQDGVIPTRHLLNGVIQNGDVPIPTVNQGA